MSHRLLIATRRVRRKVPKAVMDRDARRMRGTGPTVFAQVTHGVGVEHIAAEVMGAWAAARG